MREAIWPILYCLLFQRQWPSMNKTKYNPARMGVSKNANKVKRKATILGLNR